jgi:hypothetical protein
LELIVDPNRILASPLGEGGPAGEPLTRLGKLQDGVVVIELRGMCHVPAGALEVQPHFVE